MATWAVIFKELNNPESWVGMGRATGRSEAGRTVAVVAGSLRPPLKASL